MMVFFSSFFWFFIDFRLFWFCSRRSSTQCTNTNQGSTWYVLVIFCNYLTRLSELMYLLKLILLLWQHIKTRKSRSSKSTTIPLPKDSGIREPESHRRSKTYLHILLQWGKIISEKAFYYSCFLVFIRYSLIFYAKVRMLIQLWVNPILIYWPKYELRWNFRWV